MAVVMDDKCGWALFQAFSHAFSMASDSKESEDKFIEQHVILDLISFIHRHGRGSPATDIGFPPVRRFYK